MTCQVPCTCRTAPATDFLKVAANADILSFVAVGPTQVEWALVLLDFCSHGLYGQISCGSFVSRGIFMSLLQHYLRGLHYYPLTLARHLRVSGFQATSSCGWALSASTLLWDFTAACRRWAHPKDLNSPM